MLSLTLAAVLCLLLTLPGIAMADYYRFGTYEKAKFQAAPVYSGPGTDYFRANSGKAQYGGGVARLYGREGDWLMIGYELGTGDYRIGYIDAYALETAITQNLNPPQLTFEYAPAYAKQACKLTDDPVMNTKQVVQLAQNQDVTFLGYFNESWCYVEASTKSGTMRGFVRTQYITITGEPQPTPEPEPTQQGVLPDHVTSSIVSTSAVWSGPRANSVYYRANNNGASVSKGSTIRFYGMINDYALIGYSLSAGGFRIGYVPASCVHSAASRAELALAYRTAFTTQSAALTDDPVMRRTTLLTLPRDTQVTFLAYLNQERVWAYVECYTAQTGYTRGFVKANALNIQ